MKRITPINKPAWPPPGETIRTSSLPEKISISGFKSQISGLEKVIVEQQAIIVRQSKEFAWLRAALKESNDSNWTASFLDRINTHLRECGVYMGAPCLNGADGLQRLDMICRIFNSMAHRDKNT